MSEKIGSDLSGVGGLLETWMATQKKFAPSGQVMAQVAEAVRTISQAQVVYSQAVMRANSALLAAIWEAGIATTGQKGQIQESPDKAARQPGVPTR